MSDTNALSENLTLLADAYRQGLPSGEFLPAIYVIDPVNICNYDCIMCPTQRMPKSKKGFMDYELFCSIVDKIKDVAKVVLLYNMGEPLLHPHIIDMISYLKKNHLKSVLSTNVSRLSENLSQKILHAGLDEIILCIDGNSAETYEQIRRRGNFQDVVNKATSFLEMATNYPITSYVQMINMHINKHEHDEFLEHWSQYKCVPVVTWFDTWAGNEGFFSLSDVLCPNTHVKRHACADLWFKMAINCQGEVVLCPEDWSYQVVLGDIKRQTIKAIWQSDQIAKIRKEHLTGNYRGICANCNNWSRMSEEFEYFDLSNDEKEELGSLGDSPHFLLSLGSYHK